MPGRSGPLTCYGQEVRGMCQTYRSLFWNPAFYAVSVIDEKGGMWLKEANPGKGGGPGHRNRQMEYYREKREVIRIEVTQKTSKKLPDYIISYIPYILVYTGQEFPTGEKTWMNQCKCMSHPFTVVGTMVNKLTLLRY